MQHCFESRANPRIELGGPKVGRVVERSVDLLDDAAHAGNRTHGSFGNFADLGIGIGVTERRRPCDFEMASIALASAQPIRKAVAHRVRIALVEACEDAQQHRDVAHVAADGTDMG